MIGRQEFCGPGLIGQKSLRGNSICADPIECAALRGGWRMKSVLDTWIRSKKPNHLQKLPPRTGEMEQKPVLLLLYARYPNINVWMSNFTSTQCALAFKELFFTVTTCRIAMTSTSHRGSKPGQSTDIEHIQHSTLTPGCPADKTLLDPPDPGSKHSSPPNPKRN